MEVWLVSHPSPFTPQGKNPWYPLDGRLGGPQSQSGRDGEGKNTQPLPGLEPPIIQPVAQRYTTELSRLHKDMILRKIMESKAEEVTGVWRKLHIKKLRNVYPTVIKPRR
jgi:hypothetical protein